MNNENLPNIKKLTVEYRALAELIPYARNSRTHSEEQVAQIAGSIKEFGFTNPVLIDGEGGIIAGHGRVLASRKLSLEQVPCIRLDNLTDAQRRAYVIADNKLALNAGWDDEMLRLELGDLMDGGFDMSLVGFTEEELAALMGGEEITEGLTDADETPEPPAQPVSVLGDVWVLGRHRVMCGDSTDAATVNTLFAGKNADLCLTDPPYGLADTKSEKNDYIEYDDSAENLKTTIAGFLPIAMEMAKAVVLTPGNKNQRFYPSPNWTMAWFTPAGVGCGPWGWCCWQPILCYGKDPKLSQGKGRHPDAVVHTESAEKNGHPCPKPINFWVWLMNRTSEIGDSIYEPFSGSGTTIIAAEQTARICYAMELSPAYVDVAVRRWQSFTGKQATLEGDGRTFDELAAERVEVAA